MTPRRQRIAQELRLRDNAKSLLLVLAIVLIATLATALVFGWIAVPLVAAFLALSLAATRNPQLLLRLRRAVPLSPEQAPELTLLARQLARRAGVATPRLYLVPGAEPNALTTGSSRNSVVALTPGLLRMLAPAELAAVVAHEIAHLKHGDLGMSTLVETTIAVASQLIRIAAWVGFALALWTGEGWGSWLMMALLSIFTPTVLRLIQLLLSRTREFAADTLAAQLTGDPRALASALHQIEGRAPSGWAALWRFGRHPQWDPTPDWLRSHPPTQERIDRLLALSGETSARERRPPAPPRILLRPF
jgi:heat shock protein HtpX